MLALASTVVPMVCMGYFMLGSLPLLVLNHDTPLDARFIRNFFNVHYNAVLPVSAITSIAYSFAGQLVFRAGMAILTAVMFLARRKLIPAMDALRATMTLDAAPAIARFRRLHMGGMLLNAVRLAEVGVSLLHLGLQP